MIHKYFLNGYYIVIDTNSGAVHIVDELLHTDCLISLRKSSKGECPDEIISTLVNEGFDKQDIIDYPMPNSRLCVMTISLSPRIPTDHLQICSLRRR